MALKGLDMGSIPLSTPNTAEEIALVRAMITRNAISPEDELVLLDAFGLTCSTRTP